MEQRFCILRKHLNELGYHQTLSYDSVPLVEQLLGDLVKTTESLFHYKNVAQTVIEERDQLQLGAEPYKCDNAKLVQECNDLHLAFIQFKEQTDKLQKDLKHQIESLEKENQDLSRTVDRLHRTSERASSGYSTRRTIPSKTSLRHSATSVDTKSTKSEKHICTSEKMGGKEELQCLRQENCKLKADLIKQLELAECLSEKLDTRDEEIKRLTGLLEGGRPLDALNADCCYKEVTTKMAKISEENCKLKCSRDDLELQLAEAIRKQHEAMKRALMLADRNKELERELHDIDQMALAVEAECNCKVKEHIDKAAKCQAELNYAYQKIETLEREINEFRRKRHSVDNDYLNTKEEKENLHRILETALDDKRRMTERMNQFQKIEHDLNNEIDKLAQTCTCQKQQIADLEIQLVSEKTKGGKTKSEKTEKNINAGGKGDKKSGRKLSVDSGKKSRGSSPGKASRGSSPAKGSSPRRGSKDSTTKPDKNKSVIEKLTKERDDLQNKCKALQEQLDSDKKIGKKLSPSKMQGGDTLKRNLKEKDDKISKLEKNIQNLTREKHELMTKLEETNKGSSQKPVNSKAEKERDMARGDCKKLEEERDGLRQKLKQVTEAHSAETKKLQQLVTETEKKLIKIENERKELATVQGNRRATINNLEEKVESLSSQLRTTENELDHMRTIHSQLKTLHEQTDQALANAQEQLNQIEGDYAKACQKICDLEEKRIDAECECTTLKQDYSILKTKLTAIDGERDNLLIEIDDKTERIANLEMELNTRNTKMMTLEKLVTELQQKLSSYTDELASKEYLLKNNSSEMTSVRRTLDDAMKDKNSAVMENKRLQEDFAKASYECKCANNDLDRAKREIEDLKTQLQQYVFEIKRAEDLISKKEIERTEMLDQFRNLSEETTVLETNNHTLESQAMEVRNQLSTATNHIHDLESKVDQLHTLNKDYEKQISQMTKQIASLETQVRQSGTINRNVETEMSDMKCLCVKLDEQKETLKKEMKQREDYSRQLEAEKEHLRSEMNRLQDALHKETSNIGSLENLLATCRQETVEQRLLNQELQGEIHRLKNMVQELQSKLNNSDNNNNNNNNNSSSTKKYVCIDMDGMPSSPTTKPCVHRYDGEKEKKARECCNKRTCSKRNQNEIPEKTIFDEVCLHKTMYCSGTQQNLQVLPEQRNVAIQQIFHNQPEYVERDNKNKNESNVIYRKCSYKHDDDDDDDDDDVDGGNKVSLGRFYLPEKYKTICLRIPVEETGSNKTVYSKRMETQNPAVCSCNCPVCSRKEIDERKRSVCGDTAAPNRKICPNKAITATTTTASAASNSISISNRMKEYQKVEPKRVFIDSVPEIKTTFEKPPYVKSTSVRPQTSPKITTAPEKQKPDSPEKKSKSQKYVGTGLVRNSAFWKDDEPEAETPPASTSPPPSPSPKTSTKPKAKEKEKSKSKTKSKEIIQNSDMTTTIRRDSPVKAVNTVNALNYQTFHSDKPPVEIEPPKENIMSRDEEIALRKSRRRTQALTLQKSCMLRKTLNLDDSRTRLIYRTHISNTSSPFRSKSSERHYDKRNNYKYNDNDNDDDDDDDDDDSTRSSSDTIIVVPEACKQNIVDGPRFVTFSRSTRCKTIEDIDAKCRQLLQLNFEQADDDEF